MTEVQNNLWPDEMPTNPSTVADIYNKSSSTYAKDVIKDGWYTSFELLRSELKTIFTTLPTGKEIINTDCKQSKQQVVLDAGCAEGILADQIDFTQYNVSLHGFDIADELVSIARGKEKYSSMQVADLSKDLPFEDNYFDVVVSNGVLGYVPSDKPVYELIRVLKPGGRLIFSMRAHHFKDRGYPKAFKEQSNKCQIIKKEVFSAFPNNPEFKHEYNFFVVKKFN